MENKAVKVDRLSHRFGEVTALDGVSLAVERGETFALLGPNGGGKSTLFRLLATVLPMQDGGAWIEGFDLRAAAAAARAVLGVLFQHPSLDRKLTVEENLRHHGRLYGLWGRPLARRIAEVCGPLGLDDKRGALVEVLSGGWQRRAEIAKALVPGPRVLLLDEPTTGLDPAARRDFWEHIESLRSREGCSILVTTHLIEEAALCDRVAILDGGRLVAAGDPAELIAGIGGSRVVVATREPGRLLDAAQADLGLAGQRVGDVVRFETADGAGLVKELSGRYGPMVDSVTLSRPTLEDVFFTKTGHLLDA